MQIEMTMRENLIMMATIREYRERTAKNQREGRNRRGRMALHRDLFWAERNRIARTLYRKLVEA